MMDKTWREGDKLQKKDFAIVAGDNSSGHPINSPSFHSSALSVYLDGMFKCLHLLVVDDILQVCTLYHDHLEHGEISKQKTFANKTLHM